MSFKKKQMLNYIIKQNLFVKKYILLSIVTDNLDLSAEEKSEQILKINKMSEKELNSIIENLVEMYAWLC